MQKLLTYLKQGNGRGLRGMFIFSVLATLLSWGMNYPKLQQISLMTPNFSVSLWGLHLGFIAASFAGVWLLYIIVVGISALFTKLFCLKLPKGALWRSTAVSMIALFVLSIILTVIAYLLTLLGEIASAFYPVVIMLLIPVLLVMLIAFALAEPKEGKKKK